MHCPHKLRALLRWCCLGAADAARLGAAAVLGWLHEKVYTLINEHLVQPPAWTCFLTNIAPLLTSNQYPWVFAFQKFTKTQTVWWKHPKRNLIGNPSDTGLVLETRSKQSESTYQKPIKQDSILLLSQICMISWNKNTTHQVGLQPH